MTEQKKLPEKIVSMFAMGTFCSGIYYSLVNSYYNFYCTDVAMVPAQTLGTASFIVRLIFVFLTPMLAVLVQNGHSKFGKYRKWIFVGVPITVAACSWRSSTPSPTPSPPAVAASAATRRCR